MSCTKKSYLFYGEKRIWKYLKEDIIDGLFRWDGYIKLVDEFGDRELLELAAEQILVVGVKLVSAVNVHHRSDGPGDRKQHHTLHGTIAVMFKLTKVKYRMLIFRLLII